MTIYSVNDRTTREHEDFYSLTPAKKWMKERMSLGHEVSGGKVRFYANGDMVQCGAITLQGSNKTFIANSRMTKANY